MIDKEIIGGVSPLKQRQKSRGGQDAKTATSKSIGQTSAQNRGGFAKSKGVRGGGGRNVGGYNAQTRFKVEPWRKPPSGGTTVIPTKPYSYDADGNMQVDPSSLSGTDYRTLPGEEAKKGNEFADNCYGAGGERLKGTSYYSEKKGMQIACAWDEDAKDDGSFDYNKEATDPKDQYRTWKQENKDSAKTFSEWQDLVKNK